MKNPKAIFRTLFATGLVVATAAIMINCSDDDDPAALQVTSITSSDNKDLNGATAASDVDADATIKITFSKEVDATTVNTSNFTLTQGASAVAITATASGADVTLAHETSFNPGTTYTLTVSPSVKAKDGGKFEGTSITFKTYGKAFVTPPQADKQVAYWLLDGDAKDNEGTYADGTIVGGLTFVADRKGFANGAANFDGADDLIEIPNASNIITSSLTISFWAKLADIDHGHFVMGLADMNGFYIEINQPMDALNWSGTYKKADNTMLTNNIYFNGDGMDKDNGGWGAIDFEKDLTGSGKLTAKVKDTWAQIVLIYDAPNKKRHVYINGELMETDNFANIEDLATISGLAFNPGTTGVGTSLAFGFMHDRNTTHWDDEPWGDYDLTTANHFKGALDDIRFFSTALTAAEVTTLYNAEK